MNAAKGAYLRMRILIVSATKMEIRRALSYFRKSDSRIEFLVTGVGGVATAYALTSFLKTRRVSVAIQAGIAGYFMKATPGEVIAVRHEIPGDLGVWEDGEFKTIFDLRLSGRNTPPFKKSLLTNPYRRLISLTHLRPVRGISVNEISTDPRKIRWFKQYFDPVVESMEGSAFHYVCLREKLPFVQLRAISNKIGERDKSKWMLGPALDNLNTELINFANELSKYDETFFRL